MGVIDEVKQRLDIVEIIGEYTKLTKSGRNFRGLCPFHSEKNPSFYVYPERQSWHCFGACATGGDVFAFIMRQQNIDFGEALRLLAQRAGVTIPERQEGQAERDERNRLYEVNAAAARYFHEQLLNNAAGQKARDYLARRGITPETISGFQLGYSLNSREVLKKHLADNGYTEADMLAAGLLYEDEKGPNRDRFRNKLMFPIFDARSRVTGFGARVLDDSLPKYINSPQTPIFDKSGSLYAINKASAAIRQQEVAVIVEGYMDVLTAHQHGFNNVVASMGIAITDKQVNAVEKLTKNLTLVLDADTAGKEAMMRSIEGTLVNEVEGILHNAGGVTSLNREVRVAVLPKDKDPDEIIKENPELWDKLTTEAMHVVDYIFDMVASGLDLTKTKDKTQAVEKLLPIVAQIRNVTTQTQYVNKLATLVKLKDRTLEEALRQMKPARAKKPAPSPETAGQRLKPFFASPLEADCLTLLLQHPELRDSASDLLPEYFENTENRAVFLAWRETGDSARLKDTLDPALQEYVDTLSAKNLPPAPPEQRYADYLIRLRQRHYRNLEARRAEVFAVAAESGGRGADLARLEEEGIEPSRQLKEIFAEQSQQRPELRR